MLVFKTKNKKPSAIREQQNIQLSQQSLWGGGNFLKQLLQQLCHRIQAPFFGQRVFGKLPLTDPPFTTFNRSTLHNLLKSNLNQKPLSLSVPAESSTVEISTGTVTRNRQESSSETNLQKLYIQKAARKWICAFIVETARQLFRINFSDRKTCRALRGSLFTALRAGQRSSKKR